jgi:hypothetical protein
MGTHCNQRRRRRRRRSRCRRRSSSHCTHIHIEFLHNPGDTCHYTYHMKQVTQTTCLPKLNNTTLDKNYYQK